MNLAWTVERDADVSLVRCRVHNDSAVPRRVRIESQLEGPVLPPRRAGVPEAGWDETGVTLRLKPDERRALGFAALAPPVDPPVAVVRSPAVDADGCHSGIDSEAVDPDPETCSRSPGSVRDALRDLAEHRPPRAAIAADTDTGDADRRENEAGIRADGSDDGPGIRGDDCSAADLTNGDPGSDNTDLESPSRAAIDEWFDAVEHRIGRAERVTDADLSTATDAVESAGGVDELAALDERVESDAERLRDLSDRAASLATRAEATDTPIEALERLS